MEETFYSLLKIFGSDDGRSFDSGKGWRDTEPARLLRPTVLQPALRVQGVQETPEPLPQEDGHQQTSW